MQEIKTNIGGDAPLPKTLSAGSVVYRLHNNEITHIITIDRITKTRAISNNGTYSMIFNINVSKFGRVTEISASRNYWEKYSIETPELKEQYLRQGLIKELQTVDFTKLRIENLQRILAIIKEDL